MKERFFDGPIHTRPAKKGKTQKVAFFDQAPEDQRIQ